jgi:amidase
MKTAFSWSAVGLGLVLACPGQLAAQTLLSANGHPWDVDTGHGYIDDGGDDAFDEFGSIGVQIKSPGGSTLFSDTELSGFGLTFSGRTWMTPTPLVLGEAGVQVSRTLYAPSDQNYIRYLETFTNTSSLARQLTVIFGGDLGSDSGTTLARTSSGNVSAGITSADSWMISIEDYSEAFNPNALATDPPVGLLFGNTAVFAGTAAFWSADPFTLPWPGNGDDELAFRFQFTLDPGQTSNLVLFLYRGLQEGSTGPLEQTAPARGSEVALAQSVLTNLSVNPDYTGLSTLQIDQIVNFTPVPEPSTWLLLLGGLAFVAWVAKSRRR